MAVQRTGTKTKKTGSFRELQPTARMAAIGMSQRREKFPKLGGPVIILKQSNKRYTKTGSNAGKAIMSIQLLTQRDKPNPLVSTKSPRKN